MSEKTSVKLPIVDPNYAVLRATGLRAKLIDETTQNGLAGAKKTSAFNETQEAPKPPAIPVRGDSRQYAESFFDMYAKVEESEQAEEEQEDLSSTEVPCEAFTKRLEEIHASDATITRDLYGFPVPRNALYSYQEWFQRDLKSSEKHTKMMKRFFNPKVKGMMLSETQLGEILERGIPRNYRGECWCAALRVDQYIESYPDTFKTLLSSESIVSNDDADIVDQIERDVPRAFPELQHQRQRYNDRLKNVLLAFSRYNRCIGYCQGFNFLAGVLIQFMSTERAFWALKVLVEDRMPGYFTTEVTGIKVDNKLFAMYTAIYLEDIAEHFKRCNMQTQLITTEWFMCLFSKNLPPETTFRVWDAFLVHGSCVMFEYGLRMLKYLEYDILASRDMCDIIKKINEMLPCIFDIAQLKEIVIDPPIDNDRVELWRMALRNRLALRNKKNRYAV